MKNKTFAYRHLILIVVFLIIFAELRTIASEPICLENMAQDFVIESKQILLPKFQHAFNPSIIRWRGFLLLSFRVIPDPKKSFNSEIGLVWLDDQFDPIGEPELLELRKENDLVSSRAEDARLITIGDHLLMVYSDNFDAKISRGGFRVFVAEVTFDGEHFQLENPEPFLKFEGASTDKREKNWVPFESNGNLFLAYSLEPHKIFSPNFGSQSCETVAVTETHTGWLWGELRGGTPGFKINESQFLSFFHSSIDMESLESGGINLAHYFIGAYIFSAAHPFEITHISPEPIIGTGFYTGPSYKPYWKPVKVVFPCGYVFDEKNIWIAYGKQDREVWIARLDKKGLLDSLIPVPRFKDDIL